MPALPRRPRGPSSRCEQRRRSRGRTRHTPPGRPGSGGSNASPAPRTLPVAAGRGATRRCPVDLRASGSRSPRSPGSPASPPAAQRQSNCRETRRTPGASCHRRRRAERCQATYLRATSSTSNPPLSARLRASASASSVSSVIWPGFTPNGPPPTTVLSPSG